eukprot:scaffold10383_cov117-Isochrysis_galbana.AAC.9
MRSVLAGALTSPSFLAFRVLLGGGVVVVAVRVSFRTQLGRSSSPRRRTSFRCRPLRFGQGPGKRGG